MVAVCDMHVSYIHTHRYDAGDAPLDTTFIEDTPEEEAKARAAEPSIQQQCADLMMRKFFGQGSVELAQQFLMELKTAYKISSSVASLPWESNSYSKQSNGEETTLKPVATNIGKTLTPGGVQVEVYKSVHNRCTQPGQVAAVGSTLTVHYTGKIDTASATGKQVSSQWHDGHKQCISDMCLISSPPFPSLLSLARSLFDFFLSIHFDG